MEVNLGAYFDKASSIIIALPRKPYFDQVAAGLSLYLSLLGRKEVSIICSSPMLVEFNRLVGVDKVMQQPVERNLVIYFSGYSAENIERVSSEVKDGELYLMVIPQPKADPINKDQVKISYSGVSCDLVVLIGGAEEAHFSILSNPQLLSVPKIHIGLRDIRQSKDNNILSYVRTSSSVSELVADIIRELGFEVDADIASNLIAGIELGSSHYTSEGVSANTFQTVADLLKLGGRRMVLPFKQTSSSGSHDMDVFKKTDANEKLAQKNDVQEDFVLNKNNVESDLNEDENPPSDWLTPKIFKGTQVS